MAHTPNPIAPEIRRKRLFTLALSLFVVMALALGGAWVFAISMSPYKTIGLLMVVASVGVFGGLKTWADRIENDERAERISKIERVIEAHPEKSKPAWDLASAKLEAYADRNLSHITWIFYLTVFVMALGFGLIVWGVWTSFNESTFRAGLVAAAAGVITQFFGATFLLVYKSTMSQAKEYVSMLERINAVGMAAQLLESIKDPDPKVKDHARVELVGSLLNMYHLPAQRPMRKKKLKGADL